MKKIEYLFLQTMLPGGDKVSSLCIDRRGVVLKIQMHNDRAVRIATISDLEKLFRGHTPPSEFLYRLGIDIIISGVDSLANQHKIRVGTCRFINDGNYNPGPILNDIQVGLYGRAIGMPGCLGVVCRVDVPGLLIQGSHY